MQSRPQQPGCVHEPGSPLWRARPRVAVLVSLVVFGATSLPVLAHSGSPPVPDGLWSKWDWQPGLLAGVAVAASLYVFGLGRLWRRFGFGVLVAPWRAETFLAGQVVLVAALVSPLDALSAALFSAHMAQHLLLILVTAPLIVLGRPRLPVLLSLPRSWQRRLGRLQRLAVFHSSWRMLSRPAAAWGVSVAALWLWHLPLLFQAALKNDLVHAAEHACLLATALLFWHTLFDLAGRKRLGYAPAIASAFGMALQGTALGIALTFSAPWYGSYAVTTTAWGLTSAQDQQIAGLIMWVPAGAVYLLAALWLLVRWFEAGEDRGVLRERQSEGV